MKTSNGGKLQRILLALGAVALFAGAARADLTAIDDLVNDARATVTQFTTDPSMGWFRENVNQARGMLIVPRLRKGGFMVGGTGGSGALLLRDNNTGEWSYPAFYTIASFTFGPQIGGEVSQVILLIMTQKGMDSLLASSVKLGADIEAAGGEAGVGAKAVTSDILAFSRSQGLFAGTTVEGAMVRARDGWNEEYYGRAVRPLDILVNRSAHNAQADPLRQALVSLAGGTAPTAPRRTASIR